MLRTVLWLGVIVVLAGVAYFLAQANRLDVGAVSLTADPMSSGLSKDSQNLSLVALPGTVVNANGALGAFAGFLEILSETWQQDLGIELQIVSADLADKDLEVYAAKLFQAREVGRDQINGGLLVVLDGSGGRARIEVSYELEPAFPDAFVGRVAEQQLVPYMGASMTGMAVQDTIKFLKDFAFLQAAAGNLPNSMWATRSGAYRNKMAFLSGGAGASVLIDELLQGLLQERELTEAELSAYQPSADPEETIAAVLRLWRDQVPTPNLEIYTPGSRQLLAFYPYAPFEVAERLARLERSGDLITTICEDRAVVTSSDPVPGTMPLLLHRIDGLWRLDEVETWKNIFFDPQGNFFLKNNNNPYNFGLGEYGRGGYFDIAAIDLKQGTLEEAIEALRSRDDALAHFELAELLTRNAFIWVGAWDEYEKAIELAPNDPLFRATLADRYLYTSMPDMAIPHLELLGPEAALTLVRAYAAAQDWVKTEEAAREALTGNPYATEALEWLSYALRQQKKDNAGYARRIRAMKADQLERFRPVRLQFYPARPVFHHEDSIEVDGTTLYGYSEFSITMTNPSARPVRIRQVMVEQLGASDVVELGDISDQWTWQSGQRVLQPGEQAPFSQVWGSTSRLDEQRLSYRFTVCWQGLGDPDEQCEATMLHLDTTANSLAKPMVY